jgi:hypothetical protein
LIFVIDWLPEVAVFVVHVAEQLVTFTELQLSNVLPPEATLLGLATSVTLGANALLPRGITAKCGRSL